MSSLQQVLDRIEGSRTGFSIPSLAKDLGLSPGLVEGMLDFWVRKGRLRVDSPAACRGCGPDRKCGLVADQLKVYQPVGDGEPGLESCPYRG